LFCSQKNITGNCLSEAKFRLSDVTPSSPAASPRNTHAHSVDLLHFAASAAPVATGMAHRTIAEVPAMPTFLSIKCIEPPRDPAQPLARQYISASIALRSPPLAR